MFIAPADGSYPEATSWKSLITHSTHRHPSLPTVRFLQVWTKTKLRGLSPRANYTRRPLLSSGQSSWLQIQRSGFDSRCYQIFWEVVGLEQGPLSLVSTNEELLERKSSGSGLEIRQYGRRDPSCWPRGTLYPEKLALTSPTSGCRWVGIFYRFKKYNVYERNCLIQVFRAKADWMYMQLLRTSYSYNCYIWLIINGSSKQSVLAVLGGRQHFSRQTAKGFRRKLSSVKSRSNQSVLWTIYIMWGCVVW
jgi:hypothetical protein